ncbi:hypothetical protein ACFL1B_00410 [Nanoarchaeota archaeon]
MPKTAQLAGRLEVRVLMPRFVPGNPVVLIADSLLQSYNDGILSSEIQVTAEEDTLRMVFNRSVLLYQKKCFNKGSEVGLKELILQRSVPREIVDAVLDAYEAYKNCGPGSPDHRPAVRQYTDASRALLDYVLNAQGRPVSR